VSTTIILSKIDRINIVDYILEKDLDEEDDSSVDKDDTLQSVRKSPTSPPPLTAVSVAAITPVRASSLNDNDMSMLYPNLFHALGDDDGFFDNLYSHSRHRPKTFTPVSIFSLPSDSMTPMMIGAMVTIHLQCGFR